MCTCGHLPRVRVTLTMGTEVVPRRQEVADRVVLGQWPATRLRTPATVHVERDIGVRLDRRQALETVAVGHGTGHSAGENRIS